LSRDIFGKFRPVLKTLGNMATGTVQSKSSRKKSHRVHEFVDGNSLQNLDVLERVFHHDRLAGGARLGSRRNSQGKDQEGCNHSFPAALSRNLLKRDSSDGTHRSSRIPDHPPTDIFSGGIKVQTFTLLVHGFV